MQKNSSVLGTMVHYLNTYSPILAELADSLRAHQEKCTIYMGWGPEYTEAFDAIKKEITSGPILRYYETASL